MTMEGGAWSGGPAGGDSSAADLASIRRLQAELAEARERLRVADEERALLDVKNRLLVEMVGAKGLSVCYKTLVGASVCACLGLGQGPIIIVHRC
jgi:hypothetical protein